eukprot:scaffold235899_cov49-Prasinocladus_malaysianus.AAC.4
MGLLWGYLPGPGPGRKREAANMSYGVRVVAGTESTVPVVLSLNPSSRLAEDASSRVENIYNA